MAKKKTTYSVTLNLKYKTHYYEQVQREIKAEDENEAKKLFLEGLANSNPTLNLLFSIDDNI